MLEPKEVEFTLQNGTTKTFVLSKFPAIAGREIVSQYPLSSMPKVGDYQVNEAIMLKLMGFVSVKIGDKTLPLTTKELINNHVGDWETLGKIEIAMLEYNCSFFLKEKVLSFFDAISRKVPESIIRILTASLEQSSQTIKPPSES